MCRETHESNLFSFRLSAAIERENDTNDPEQWVMRTGLKRASCAVVLQGLLFYDGILFK